MADHSKSALCASGLSLEQIEEQHRKADRQILKGSRRPLGYTDNALDRFAFFVASIHGRFKLDRTAQTERLLRAVANEHTTIQVT